MDKSRLVEEFFARYHDAELGERIAAAFRRRYEGLKKQHTPREIFYELQRWAGGDYREMPSHELALAAVMAYSFERCDIYEAPRSASA